MTQLEVGVVSTRLQYLVGVLKNYAGSGLEGEFISCGALMSYFSIFTDPVSQESFHPPVSPPRFRLWLLDARLSLAQAPQSYQDCPTCSS